MATKKFKDHLSHKLKGDYSKILLPAAVLWFSIRVIPRPSRISYPCQQATLGLFLVKLGIVFSTLVASATSLFEKRAVKTFSVLVLVGAVLADPVATMYYQYKFSTSGIKLLTIKDMAYGFPSNRVVRVHGNNATNWDFSTGYYWQYIDQLAVDRMVEDGVKALTGAPDPQTAWQTIMSSYVSGDKVGIKINGNDWWNTDQREIDSIPQVTNTIVKGLKSIGVPESDIHVIENTYPSITRRVIPTYYTDIVTAKYPNVVFQYATATSPTYGGIAGTTVTFPYSPSSRRINDQIASVDHLILVPIMKAITPSWGITGTIKLMQGVIEGVSDFHSNLARATADNPDVLIYQNAHIINKTRLIVGDGLFGAWTGQHFTGGYGGTDVLISPVDDVPKPWITFGNKAPNSLFFAVDPVAADSVMYDNILRERNAQDQVAGQSLAPFNEPQLIAGEAAGLGIREHGPPYTNIDYVQIELGGAPPPIHDVAVTNVTPTPTTVTKGELVNVKVTVDNQGSANEVFDVSAYYDTSLIEKRTGISLSAGYTQDVTFTWDTASVAEDMHTIKAEASAVPGETDLADNSYLDGTVTVNPLVVHDVAIIDVSASPITASPGQIVNVTVVAKNEGTQSETFAITAYANTTQIGSRNVALTVGGTSTEFFSWNTTGALGIYLIMANVTVVSGETDTADNTRQFDGAVAIFPYPVEFPVASFVYSPNAPLVGANVTFDGSGSSDLDGTIVSYIWDFGDGNQGNGALATHLYLTSGNYTVTLTVTDNDGLFDIERKSLTVRKHPQASFTFSPTAPKAHQVITFNASLSTPEGGVIISYFWDFGDGTTTSQTSPVTNHTYSLPQTFTVRLNVTDSEGLWDTDSQLVIVIKAPKADFSFSPANPLAGQIVNFDAGTSASEGGSITSYRWDFGDGTQVTENDPAITHLFSVKGTYTVTLTVTDDEGLSDTAFAQVSVEEKPAQPWLSMEFMLALIVLAITAVAVVTAIFLKRRS